MARTRAGDGASCADGDGDRNACRRAGEGERGAVGGEPLFNVRRDVRVVDKLQGSARRGQPIVRTPGRRDELAD
jgi:hypothetical protein